MTRALRVRPEAERDLRDARAWYERAEAGLGDAFLEEVELVLDRIAEIPLQYPLVHRDVRRALVHRFPYAVFFDADHDAVLILAVLHQARSPRVARRRAR